MPGLRTDIEEHSQKVVVYCSASLNQNEKNENMLNVEQYKEDFKALGRRLVEQGYGIVYGGGAGGLMGALHEVETMHLLSTQHHPDMEIMGNWMKPTYVLNLPRKVEWWILG